MKLNTKWTWGLAWAGLAVVVAVPSVDFLTGKSGKTAAVLTSTIEPVTTAVTTKVTPNGISIMPAGSTAVAATSSDPVDGYLKSNKKLPDYISGGSTNSSVAPTEVAAIDPTPAPVAPVPFPARPPDVILPAAAPTAAPKTANIDASPEQPFVVDEPPAATDEATLDAPAGPVPPEPINDGTSWRSKSLEKYLDQNGLMDDSPARSTANLTVVNRSGSDYDPNGFYLNDGPNNARAERRRRVLEMLDQQDDSDTTDFTLF